MLLESDLNPYDRYGRRLAYVYLEGQRNAQTVQGKESPLQPESSVNAKLLRQGLVSVLFFVPNKRHEVVFQMEQSHAQKEGVGLWGVSTFRG